MQPYVASEDELLLIIYRLAYPKAMAAEIIVFIALESTNHRIYSHQDISRAETRLGFGSQGAPCTSDKVAQGAQGPRGDLWGPRGAQRLPQGPLGPLSTREFGI